MHIHPTVNNPSKQPHFRQVCSACNTRVKKGAFGSWSCFSDPKSLDYFLNFPNENLCIRSSPEQIFFFKILKEMSRGFFFYQCLKKSISGSFWQTCICSFHKRLRCGESLSEEVRQRPKHDFTWNWSMGTAGRRLLLKLNPYFVHKIRVEIIWHEASCIFNIFPGTLNRCTRHSYNLAVFRTFFFNLACKNRVGG